MKVETPDFYERAYDIMTKQVQALNGLVHMWGEDDPALIRFDEHLYNTWVEAEYILAQRQERLHKERVRAAEQEQLKKLTEERTITLKMPGVQGKQCSRADCVDHQDHWAFLGLCDMHGIHQECERFYKQVTQGVNVADPMIRQGVQDQLKSGLRRKLDLYVAYGMIYSHEVRCDASTNPPYAKKVNVVILVRRMKEACPIVIALGDVWIC